MDPLGSELFELERPLPDEIILASAKRLIGFDARYDRIRRDLRLLSAPDEVRSWSKRLYGRELPLCDIVADRYPLLIFTGDVGTGKTVTAEAATRSSTGCTQTLDMRQFVGNCSVNPLYRLSTSGVASAPP